MRWRMAELVVNGDLRAMLSRLAMMRAPMTLGLYADSGEELQLLGFGNMEKNAPGFLCIESLNHIAMDVQEQHGKMGLFKTTPRFKNFLRLTSAGTPGSDRVLRLTDDKMAKTGSPTVEIGNIEFKFHRDSGGTLLPDSGATVITSVATAGSGEAGEWNVWFDLFDRECNEITFATVLASTDGTARNDHEKYLGAIPIQYDQYAPKGTWAELSEKLYHQLDYQSWSCSHKLGDADYIFHWGCISHYETRIRRTNQTAEGWGDHEHWNILYTIAMARHALKYLKQGGTLVLKVRMFMNAETLALVSVLACAFENVYLYRNTRMQAEFVAFVGTGFKGYCDDVVLVCTVLEKSTSYRLSDICDARIVGHPQFQATMKYAENTREEIRKDHDRFTLVMMQIMYMISEGEDSGANMGYLEAKLRALRVDAPVEIDVMWVPGVIAQVRRMMHRLREEGHENDRAKLQNFVHDFDLAKYV